MTILIFVQICCLKKKTHARTIQIITVRRKKKEIKQIPHPQMNVAAISKALLTYKVYQTMFRIVKESETVDSRQHCYLLQCAGHEPRYLSVETRQELLRIENSWNTAIVTSVIKLGVCNR